MVNIDDRASVIARDPKGMLARFEGFADQCREALRIAQTTELPPLKASPKVAGLTGMGGSAAGGDFVRALFEKHGKIPFFVNRDYTLPSYVGPGDLVFCASYSGNTEETLAGYAKAKAAGAQIVVVTSGGKLAEMGKADGYAVIPVPAGYPPRTALGLLLMPLIWACEAYKLIPAQNYEKAFKLLESCRDRWTVEAPGDNVAKNIAKACQGSVALLYGLGFYQGLVANRWKGQFNENSKNLAFPNAFPELNHNEILGWVLADGQGVKKWVVVVLEDGTESAKMKTRAAVTRKLTEKVAEWHSVQAVGDTLMERMLTLAYLGDFVSIYLAALNQVDPENIDWINVLKAELSKVD